MLLTTIQNVESIIHFSDKGIDEFSNFEMDFYMFSFVHCMTYLEDQED